MPSSICPRVFGPDQRTCSTEAPADSIRSLGMLRSAGLPNEGVVKGQPQVLLADDIVIDTSGSPVLDVARHLNGYCKRE